MVDVARHAGVSHQTVSRVLNDHPSVAETTRARVLAAIQELGYRPNTAARALVTQRTRTIGVVTSGSTLSGPTSTLVAVEDAAREAGYFVSIATAGGWDHDRMTGALERFLLQGVDGIVVVGANDGALEGLRAAPPPVPVVVLGAHAPLGPGLHAVRYDQRGGAALATEHLLALGHRQIVHVAGPLDWTEAREREGGWRDAMTAAGVEPPEPVAARSWLPGRGHEVGLDLLRDGLPTAVLAANDHLALGMLRAFAEAGVRVPADVSVVGFDDVLGSAHFIPPLTTVRHRFAEVGRRCLRMLLHVLAGEDRPVDVVGPTLVVRSSTGPPRGVG